MELSTCTSILEPSVNPTNLNNKTTHFDKVTHAGYPECYSDFAKSSENFYQGGIISSYIATDSDQSNYEQVFQNLVLLDESSNIQKNNSNNSISSYYHSEDSLSDNKYYINREIIISSGTPDSDEYSEKIQELGEQSNNKDDFKTILLSIISLDELQQNYTVKLTDNKKNILKNIIINNSDFLDNFETEFRNIQSMNNKDFIILINYFIKKIYKILYNERWIIYKSYYKKCRTILKFLFEVLITNKDNIYNKLELMIYFNILIDLQHIS
jgi:hypothetical protein